LPYVSVTLHVSLAKASSTMTGKTKTLQLTQPPQASFVLTLLAALNLFFYALVLPTVSRKLQKNHIRNTRRVDWLMAIGSTLPLCIGTLIMGLCPDLECLISGKPFGPKPETTSLDKIKSC
jgi:hypothetical protein